jgi:hypothetical protein
MSPVPRSGILVEPALVEGSRPYTLRSQRCPALPDAPARRCDPIVPDDGPADAGDRACALAPQDARRRRFHDGAERFPRGPVQHVEPDPPPDEQAGIQRRSDVDQRTQSGQRSHPSLFPGQPVRGYENEPLYGLRPQRRVQDGELPAHGMPHEDEAPQTRAGAERAQKSDEEGAIVRSVRLAGNPAAG